MKKNFWDRNAGLYDRFMRKDRAAYEKMYELIRPVVKGRTVLELATGTGLIAKNIAGAAKHIEATQTINMVSIRMRVSMRPTMIFSLECIITKCLIFP